MKKSLLPSGQVRGIQRGQRPDAEFIMLYSIGGVASAHVVEKTTYLGCHYLVWCHGSCTDGSIISTTYLAWHHSSVSGTVTSYLIVRRLAPTVVTWTMNAYAVVTTGVYHFIRR